ncbi:MAG: hypothetical protein K0S23_3205 [Fluviicola sp.]|jgi:hypothetical protein|uniref:hypothetical protein n=1 Tax=Fluviicola sp. TaxID=1917219 RepID=UPI002610A534|nr:hypothetical protein [Fluviicola sp.]MDF3028898.1 hypothetical protein [Fluviicola sp.]
MKKVNNVLFSLVCVVVLHFDLHSQNLLEQQPKIRITYIDNDSTRIHSFDGLPKPQVSVITYGRINEYFVLSDTLKRDYVLFGDSKRTIDKLQGLQQCDYTGAYEIIECRKVTKGDAVYCILCFADSFIVGTNQNMFYIIFELEKNNWKCIGSYENEADKPTDNIKVVYSKKGLRLKGKYLKQIKREGFDCLN